MRRVGDGRPAALGARGRRWAGRRIVGDVLAPLAGPGSPGAGDGAPRAAAARLGRPARPGRRRVAVRRGRGAAGAGRRGGRRGARLLTVGAAGSPLAAVCAQARGVARAGRPRPRRPPRGQPRGPLVAARARARRDALGLVDVADAGAGRERPTGWTPRPRPARPVVRVVRQPGQGAGPAAGRHGAGRAGATARWPASRPRRVAGQLAAHRALPGRPRRRCRTTRSQVVAPSTGRSRSAASQRRPVRRPVRRTARRPAAAAAAAARRRARARRRRAAARAPPADRVRGLAEDVGVAVSEVAAERRHPLERLAVAGRAAPTSPPSTWRSARAGPRRRPHVADLRDRPTLKRSARRTARDEHREEAPGAIVAALPANLGIARDQVRRLPAHRVALDAGRGDPLAGRLRQPGAAADRRQAGAARRRRRSTRSATAASATSTRSSSRSCCSASAGCSRCTRAYHKWQRPARAIDAVAVGADRGAASSRSSWRASRSAPRSRSRTTLRGDAVVARVRPHGQGARAAGHAARGLRRAARPGLRAARRGADPAHRATARGTASGTRGDRPAAGRRRGRAGRRDEVAAARRGRAARGRAPRSGGARAGAGRRAGHPHAARCTSAPRSCWSRPRSRVRADRRRVRGRRRHRRGRAAGARGRADRPGHLPRAGHPPGEAPTAPTAPTAS